MYKGINANNAGTTSENTTPINFIAGEILILVLTPG